MKTPKERPVLDVKGKQAEWHVIRNL